MIFQSTLPQGKWRDGTMSPVHFRDFNPHFRKGSDESDRWFRCWTIRNFNPHFRKGSDTALKIHCSSMHNFNPHFRKGSDCSLDSVNKGSDQKRPHKALQDQYFNPHFRKGSDSYDLELWYFSKKFQSTLPQGKWPDRILCDLFNIEISIHTSAREVTKLQLYITQDRYISIHTSAREVTIWIPLHQVLQTFQSTLPQGKWPLKEIKKELTRWFQSTLPQGKWQKKICMFTLGI